MKKNGFEIVVSLNIYMDFVKNFMLLYTGDDAAIATPSFGKPRGSILVRINLSEKA